MQSRLLVNRLYCVHNTSISQFLIPIEQYCLKFEKWVQKKFLLLHPDLKKIIIIITDKSCSNSKDKSCSNSKDQILLDEYITESLQGGCMYKFLQQITVSVVSSPTIRQILTDQIIYLKSLRSGTYGRLLTTKNSMKLFIDRLLQIFTSVTIDFFCKVHMKLNNLCNNYSFFYLFVTNKQLGVDKGYTYVILLFLLQLKLLDMRKNP